MDFSDSIKAHAKKVTTRKAYTTTEEATKMALIVPFLQILGYDPYDPCVVIPEHTADFGGKRECKVDYAIKRGDDIVMILEAKKVGDTLDGAKEGQLQQYFQSILPVKIAILTDGIRYKFYTDLENKNVMDKKPFMSFNLEEIEDALIPELKKLCNHCFDLETALCAAQELKYLGQLKKFVAEELANPTDELTRLMTKKVYDGLVTNKILEEFRPRIKMAFENHINDVLNARLQGAMQPSVYSPLPSEETVPEQSTSNDIPEIIYGNAQEKGIETTHQEIEGFHIVRALLCDTVSPEKISLKDTISYCGILYENNVRKPICKMHFNNPNNLQIEIFSAEQAAQSGVKKGEKIKINSVLDMYQFANTYKEAVSFYTKSLSKD